MNQEGYKDPTAEKAIHAAKHLPEKIWEVVKLVRETFRLVGMDIVDITVEDRKTKKRYNWRR